MQYGKIPLSREKRDYECGFSILKAELTELEHSLPLLHPDERNYYEKLRFDKRKTSYLLGRLASKKAIIASFDVNEISDILIDFGVFEFPVVKGKSDCNVQVSISHCDNIGVALAFSEEHPLGIDIEKMDSSSVETMKTQMTSKEFEILAKSGIPLPTGCAAIWTAKEGLSKILRTGMMLDFKILEIESILISGSTYMLNYSHFGQYKAISYRIKDYVCCIVMPKHTTCTLDQFWAGFATVISTVN